MIIRRLIVPLTAAVVTFHAGPGFAQSPPPWPNQTAAPNAASPFPPVNGVAPAPVPAPAPFPVTGAAPVNSAAFAPPASPSQQGAPPDNCMKEFVPMREDAEKKGTMIKNASEHHASADEACKLIRSFGQAELKMIKYVETHAAKCGIPPQVPEQLKAGHKNTDSMQAKVCAVAQQQQQQQQRAPAGPSLSEVLGSSAELPDATTAKKSGGSTFDTLNGNVLAR